MPGQGARHEKLQRFRRERQPAAAIALGEAREEVVGEERDVLAPLGERGDVELHHVQPVVQVTNKLARAILFLQFPMRGRNDSHMDVETTWVDDDDEGLARTLAALDRALARGQRWSGMLDNLCRLSPPRCLSRRRRRHDEDEEPAAA